MFKVLTGFEDRCILSSDGGCDNRCRRTKGDAFGESYSRKHFDRRRHRS